MALIKSITVTKIEDRPEDAWFDISLRKLREGEARIYRVKDELTGDWLFKVCSDVEIGRYMVKALKCPPGKLFSQLEGATMLFQKSEIRGMLYDVISSSYVDDEGRVRRDVISEMEKIDPVITANFAVKPYEEVTGKTSIGKRWVTLSKEGDEKAMIKLFIIERAWPLSPVSLDLKKKAHHLLKIIKELEKAKLEEVYSEASARLGFNVEEVDRLISILKSEGRLKPLAEGYVKSLKL